MYADENVIKIKHDVLYEVAKLAFAGELEEKKDYIANQLIPGPAAQFHNNNSEIAIPAISDILL